MTEEEFKSTVDPYLDVILGERKNQLDSVIPLSSGYKFANKLPKKDSYEFKLSKKDGYEFKMQYYNGIPIIPEQNLIAALNPGVTASQQQSSGRGLRIPNAATSTALPKGGIVNKGDRVWHVNGNEYEILDIHLHASGTMVELESIQNPGFRFRNSVDDIFLTEHEATHEALTRAINPPIPNAPSRWSQGLNKGPGTSIYNPYQMGDKLYHKFFPRVEAEVISVIDEKTIRVRFESDVHFSRQHGKEFVLDIEDFYITKVEARAAGLTSYVGEQSMQGAYDYDPEPTCYCDIKILASTGHETNCRYKQWKDKKAND